MRLIPRARSKRKREEKPSNGNSTLSRLKEKADAHNTLGNWIISSETSSHRKSETKRCDAWKVRQTLKQPKMQQSSPKSQQSTKCLSHGTQEERESTGELQSHATDRCLFFTIAQLWYFLFAALGRRYMRGLSGLDEILWIHGMW